MLACCQNVNARHNLRDCGRFGPGCIVCTKFQSVARPIMYHTIVKVCGVGGGGGGGGG